MVSVSAHVDLVIEALGELVFCEGEDMIIRTAERMKRLDGGAVLEVISDDRVILIDMPAWCRSTGNLFLGSRRDGDEFRLLVRKKEEHA